MRFTERIERSNVDGPLIARKTGFPQADFSFLIRANFLFADNPGAIQEAPLSISRALRGQSEAVVSR